MKGKIFLASLFVLLLVSSFVACSDDDSGSAYTINNLPARYSPKLPNPLKKTTAITPVSARQERCVRGGGNPGTGGGTATAYNMIKGHLAQFKAFQKSIQIQFLIVDSLWPQIIAGMINGSAEYQSGDLKLKFTQGMSDYLTSLSQEMGFEFTLPSAMVGQVIPCPRIIARNNLEGTYKFSVKFVDSFVVTGTNIESSTTVLWSQDKKQVSIIFSSKEGATEYLTFLSYDAINDWATMSYTMGDHTFTLALDGMADSSINGVYVKSVDSQVNESENYLCTISGMCDDNGGYLEIRSDSGADWKSYRETFDKDGVSTGMQSSDSVASEWVTFGADGELDPIYFKEEANYDVKETRVEVTPGDLTAGGFVIMPAGSSIVGLENGTDAPLGSGYYNGTSMSGGLSYVSYWGESSTVASAIVFGIVCNLDGSIVYRTTSANVSLLN